MSVEHQQRVVDQELHDLLGQLPATSIEGPRAVGKTWTSNRLANTVYALDDPEILAEVQSDPRLLTQGAPPILIDEWQRFPASWDIVRRSVDPDFSPGQFILTGSARPENRPVHSGAGRIVTLRMWTTALAERHPGLPSVSLKSLLAGERVEIEGASSMGLADYASEIVSGGFPGWRNADGRARDLLLDGYLHRLAEHDFPLSGHRVRNPAALHRWLTAYAAATSTSASYETIRDAATSGEGDKPAKSTTIAYRDTLDAMWILEPQPAWVPAGSHLSRLKRSPKHHLADTALAARLLHATADTLTGRDAGPHAGPGFVGSQTLGALFESMVVHDLRVYAQPADARVSHMRTWNDQREADAVIEHRGRVLAVEVKLGAEVTGHDTRHLRWLRDRLGPALIDALVVTTGAHAYRDDDGIAVIPAALLGP
ncbi:MAG: ATP-binding protein [Acidimicrobiales bacterium]|nr:ATP-binding protein [Acidimicrobiales bacterium]MYG87506.1 ATP-binding protein [Acidimicrobiales bacterium]MYI28259.1 ATP-binding protein [Acidimicrobiales bacterium]